MTVARTAGVALVRAPAPPTGTVVLAGSAVAWIALTAVTVRGHGAGHASHGVAAVAPWQPGWIAMWLLMLVAMMWPLAVPTLSVVGRAAFRGWRTALVAACLGTLTALWLLAGLAAGSVAQLLAVPEQSLGWQLGWVTVALLAGRSARRARLLERCSRVSPVAPGGVRGLVTAAGAGARDWRRCALLCGPVMTAMVVGHSPALLVGASLAAWWESAHLRAWRDPVPALLLGVAAAVLVLVEVLPGG